MHYRAGQIGTGKIVAGQIFLFQRCCDQRAFHTTSALAREKGCDVVGTRRRR